MNSLKEQYDQIALAFSESRKKQLWPELRTYLAALKPGTRLVDMGAGSGRLYSGIPPDVDYIGVDNSLSMLKEARKNHPEAAFICKDILDSQSLNCLGKFDYVFVVAVAHHLNSRELKCLFLSAKERLNTHGIIILSCWRLFSKKFVAMHFRQILCKIKKLNWRYLEVPWSCSDGKAKTTTIKRTCYAYEINKLTSAASQAGLRIQNHHKSKANIWLELCLDAPKAER